MLRAAAKSTKTKDQWNQLRHSHELMAYSDLEASDDIEEDADTSSRGNTNSNGSPLSVPGRPSYYASDEIDFSRVKKR